jgi:hypothetical protein
MNFVLPSRWRRTLAIGLVSLPLADRAGAADPVPPTPATKYPIHAVEILYGTQKVWPPPRPVILPTPVTPPVKAPPPTVVAEPTTPPPTVREDSRTEPTPVPIPIPTPTPVPAPIELRPIILTTYSTPAPPFGASASAPWLVPTTPVAVPPAPPSETPPAPAPTPSQPIVVVVREPAAESHPVTVTPAPSSLGTETLLAIGIGAAGLGFGFAGWRRRREADRPAPPAVVTAPPNPADGILLMGQYNAGPRKETAERFEIGPRYQLEQQEKKKAEEANSQAVLEFILSQNIALQTDPDAPDEALPQALEADPPAEGE